ncbi:hypothetical protein ALC62_15562 [Cyphomyrmex costatus]|uniref:Uncharacterized protein n=1 Tax=Cyphomyrmex costatus TaxID=456900 RepID=A0A195BZU2_9HYME|nr:hypothetical protein ALC62_15562 [Cyphomyrmex costatus]
MQDPQQHINMRISDTSEQIDVSVFFLDFEGRAEIVDAVNNFIKSEISAREWSHVSSLELTMLTVRREVHLPRDWIAMRGSRTGSEMARHREFTTSCRRGGCAVNEAVTPDVGASHQVSELVEKVHGIERDAINDRTGGVVMPDVALSREPSTPSCLYEVLMAILPSQRRCPRPHRRYLCLRIQSHVDSREARVSSA